MSKHTDLAKNTAIIAMGKLSTQLIGFLLLPLYTFFLSPSQYGILDLTLTYIVLLAPALTIQLEAAAFRYLVDVRSSIDKSQEVVSNIFYLLIPMTLVAAFVIGLIGFVFQFDHIFIVLLVGISTVLANITLQISRGLGDNKRYAIASIIIGASTAVSALVFLILFNMKIEGVLLSLTVSNLIGVAYLFLTLRIYKLIKRGLKNRILQGDIIGYSAPLVPDIAAWWVINASGRTLITMFLGAASNGIYAVASRYASIFNGFSNIFTMSWMESASIHINATDKEKFFADVFNASIRFFASLGVGLIAVIPFIFSWFVDPAFDEAYLYIPLLVAGSFLNAVAGLYAAVYIAKKLTKKVLSTSLLAAFISVTLTIGLLPFWGLYAAAAATGIAFLTMAIYRHIDVQKYVVIRYDKRMLFVVLLVFLASILAYYINQPALNVLSLAFAVVVSVALNWKIVKALYLKLNTILNR